MTGQSLKPLPLTLIVLAFVFLPTIYILIIAYNQTLLYWSALALFLLNAIAMALNIRHSERFRSLVLPTVGLGVTVFTWGAIAMMGDLFQWWSLLPPVALFLAWIGLFIRAAVTTRGSKPAPPRAA